MIKKNMLLLQQILLIAIVCIIVSIVGGGGVINVNALESMPLPKEMIEMVDNAKNNIVVPNPVFFDEKVENQIKEKLGEGIHTIQREVAGIPKKFTNSIADIYQFFQTVDEYRNLISEDCQSALYSLQKSPTKVVQANMASGRVIETFGLLSQAQSNPAIVNQLIYGHLNSMGDPDGCAFIEDYQYCYADIVPGTVKVGWCMPMECQSTDIDNLLNKMRAGMMEQMQMMAMQQQQQQEEGAGGADNTPPPMTFPGMDNLDVKCGNKVYPVEAGTYIMYGIIGFLLLMVMIGTYIDRPSVHERKKRKQALQLQLYNNLSRLSTGGSNSNSNEHHHHQQQQQQQQQQQLSLIQNPSTDKDMMMNNHDDEDDYDLIATIIKEFSLYKNITLLLARNRQGPFDSFDGIRVFSMLWVILGHTFIFGLLTPGYSNADFVLPNNGQGFIERYSAMAVPGGFYAVDTFFFMSGFLGCYFMLKKLTESGVPRNPLWIMVLYIQRWIRLTPTYMFLVCCNLFLVIRWGGGPFWNANDMEVNTCSEYWWTNVLYVNNLVTSESGFSCYGVSWYLANDFQFFITLPFLVLIALKLNKYIGFLVPLAGCIASWTVYYMKAYENNWGVSLFGPAFKDYYINPFARCPTYLLGVMLAMIWFFYLEEKRNTYIQMMKSEKSKYKILVTLGFLVSFVLMGITVYGQRDAYVTLPGAPSIWSRTEMSAFVAWGKSGWTLGLAIFVTLMFFGEGGPVKEFLECRLFTILARVCFCCYLIHPMVLQWNYLQQTQPMHFTNYWYAFNYAGALFLTFSTATVVHLCLERPLANLERLSRTSPAKKVVQQNQNHQEHQHTRNTNETTRNTNEMNNLESQQLMAPLLAGADGEEGGKSLV